MAKGFSLTDEQRALFDSILSDKGSISAEVSKQTKKFDAFTDLIGSGRILTEIKSKIPFSFKGEALVNCDPSNSKEVLLAVAKFIREAEQKPVLVLMNHNYKSVISELNSAGITSDYFIIDTISKSIASVKEGKELFFVDSLRNLTQLQIKMFNIMEKNNGCAFVFDSLAMLELYHEEEIVFKFIYSITKLLHKNNVNGFFISTKKESSAKLAQFFDEVIDLKKFID